MDLIGGILIILLGLFITVAGLPVFILALPLLGFFFGFFVGAAGTEALFGDGFLSTVSGWIAGFVVGVIFALLSWFFWYVGVFFAAGALGSLLGTGIVEAFGSDSEWLIFIAGLLGIVVLVGLTLVLNIPTYIIIVSTAIAGASLLITGILLVFNQVEFEELGHGTAAAAIEESWFWLIAWGVAAAIGMLCQIAMKNAVELPDERWGTAQAAT
ncbi:MAG TPA: DUF4203 domain-containing protein [Thermomicrobiales bacterium]|nr:DUF4203 domain-containing protein [Thermomicrobiales bacterium]